MDVSGLTQFGVIGALVAQTWIVFKYLEHLRNDQIAKLEQRVSDLESERKSHAQRLDHHSQHKVGRQTFSRELATINKRQESLEKHRSKHTGDNQG